MCNLCLDRGYSSATLNNEATTGVSGASSFDPSSPLASLDWGGSAVSSNTVSVYFAGVGEVFDGVASNGWTSAQISGAMAALNDLSVGTNLNFTVTNDAASATFKFVTAYWLSGTYAYMNPPVVANPGVAVFNTYNMDLSNLAAGSLEYFVFQHEVGHGLGMSHAHDTGGGSVIMDGVTSSSSLGDHNLNQGVNTMMSYNVGHAELYPSWPSTYGATVGPMAFDLAVLQDKYGARAANTGDNTYYLPDANGSGTYYSCIWDTGGDDTIAYTGSSNVTISLVAATLDYTATGGGVVSYASGIRGGYTIANGVVIENATGGSGNDSLTGNAANNILRGGDGNDTHDGGAGADLMEGGRGNDIYHVDDAGDRINESTSQGTDLVISTRSFDLSSQSINLENLILRGTAGMTGTGNDRWNELTGHQGNDRLNGLAGNDTLRGGNGNDIHDGGRGADLMEGGRGNDIYYVDNTGDRVNESTSQGTDLVVSTLSFDLSSQSINLENLILRGTANMTGTGNDRWNELTGHQGNDTLNGLAGNDTLRGGNGNDVHDGGRGADLMEGGRGNDIYHVDNAGDQVNEATSQGTDLVISTRSFDLSSQSINLENLILRGTNGMTGSGNDRWNEITGHQGNDVLNGFAGNDTLRGGNGNDTLNGGRGDDFLDGGRNTDRLDGGSGSDTYIGGSGNDTFVFLHTGSTDHVRDYSDGSDMIEIGLGVGSFSNVTVTDSGANAILTFAGATVILENVDHNLIGSDDFNFV